MTPNRKRRALALISQMFPKDGQGAVEIDSLCFRDMVADFNREFPSFEGDDVYLVQDVDSLLCMSGHTLLAMLINL